jgi:hypothetical protein
MKRQELIFFGVKKNTPGFFFPEFYVLLFCFFHKLRCNSVHPLDKVAPVEFVAGAHWAGLRVGALKEGKKKKQIWK